MNKPISWRTIFEDDSRIEWEDVIEVDGVQKPASIDDIDRSELIILQTIDSNRQPIHTLTFTKEERKTRLPVWRHFAGITPQGERVTIGALTGYNELVKGKEVLKIWLVRPDGTSEVVENPNVQLHPREVFSEERKAEIAKDQQEQNKLTEEDNDLLANPVTE